MINNNIKKRNRDKTKGLRYATVAMRNTGQLSTRSSSVPLRTVSKEALPMSRKLSSGGDGSRSMSSLISRNDGVREIPGLKMGVTGGVSNVRGAALRRIGGGDSGASAITLERLPVVNKGTSSFDWELAPEDVDGREYWRGGGSPRRALRDWTDTERTDCPREATPVRERPLPTSSIFPCSELPRVRCRPGGRNLLLAVPRESNCRVAEGGNNDLAGVDCS
jgi:hypothetical protein